MTKIIGIDEAGRGPVIGSLFIGFFIVEFNNNMKEEIIINELKKIGVDDSKKIKNEKRIEIFEKLKTLGKIKYVQLPPYQIDKSDNLNNLQLDSICKFLNMEKCDKIIIDSLTSKPENYKQKIIEKLKFKPEIICENKADENYKIVGAASIIAKVLREKEIWEIKKKIGFEFGSGYTSDPKTKIFIKEHFNNKSFDFIFRKSWKTYKNLL